MHVYKGVHTIQEGCLLRGASRENSRKPPFVGDSVRQLLPDPAKEGKLPHLSERLQEGARHRSTHYFTLFPPASLQESALPQGQGSRGSQRSPWRLGVLRSDFGRRAGQCVHAQAENRVRIASAQGAEAERGDRSERTALFGVSHAQEQRKEAEQQLVRKTMDARGYKVGFFAGMLTRSWVPPCINTPTGTKRRSL